MTEAQAKHLATFDPDYQARKIRGRWCVWSRMADHVVEFDGYCCGHCGAPAGQLCHDCRKQYS